LAILIVGRLKVKLYGENARRLTAGHATGDGVARTPKRKFEASVQ
jgi:hypothetical protein